VSHRPRKRFGQNFLQSPQIIAQIIASLTIDPNDRIIEIGPGQGALTRPLLQRLNHLTAIEIDRDLQAALSGLSGSEGRLTLINADALTIDYGQLGSELRIVGNLPYNISSPLIFHLLTFIPYIADMHFMLQKEVVERLAAPPGTRDYGRLSVMIQYFCEVEYLFDVPPEAFYPIPRVDSAIVRLTPWRVSPFPSVAFDKLQTLVARAFSMRRKTLANNLKSFVSLDILKDVGIDPGLRPEQISVMDYVRLAKIMPNDIE
jgi:16S rRNA (adenine1518-N6/adenine1519-N6)-dimethyltransferase